MKKVEEFFKVAFSVAFLYTSVLFISSCSDMISALGNISMPIIDMVTSDETTIKRLEKKLEDSYTDTDADTEKKRKKDKIRSLKKEIKRVNDKIAEEKSAKIRLELLKIDSQLVELGYPPELL